MKFTNIEKTNYYMGFKEWKIVAECDVEFNGVTYIIGLTADGLIKKVAIRYSDYAQIIAVSDLPKEIYQNISSYYSDN